MRIESESINVASKVVITAAANISRIHGQFRGSTADRWLMLFDAKAVPANGVAPNRAWPLYNSGGGTATPFDVTFLDDNLNLAQGCVLAVSTSQSTLTLSTDTMDLYVHGDSNWDNRGLISVGNYTTGTAAPVAIASGGQTLRLKRVEFTSLSGAGVLLYGKIFAKSPTAGLRPLVQIPLEDGASTDLYFNLEMIQNVDGATYNGIYIRIDEMPGPLENDYSGTDFAIKYSYSY